ncbi:MAG TPA: hypothetical protein VMB22_08425 [Verrucomicrobiae bacterium]|nr:hypothetical protein [Verrucomicrobiae bacterium]
MFISKLEKELKTIGLGNQGKVTAATYFLFESRAAPVQVRRDEIFFGTVAMFNLVCCGFVI